MKHRGIRIAKQSDLRAFIDRCLAVEEAGRSVVEAYRAMRAAGSFSGFWTHIDDLAKALPVDAASREATPSHPVAEALVGRGGPVTEASEASVSDSEPTPRAPVAGDAATPPAGFNHIDGRTGAPCVSAPGDAAPDETPAPPRGDE